MLVACGKCEDVDQSVVERCCTCNAHLVDRFSTERIFSGGYPGQPAYHREGFGICRPGRRHEVGNYHFQKCSIYVLLEVKDAHLCRKQILDANRLICRYHMAASTGWILPIWCVYGTHIEYLKQHAKPTFAFQICHKLTAAGMMEYYWQLCEKLAQEVMHSEYAV